MNKRRYFLNRFVTTMVLGVLGLAPGALAGDDPILMILVGEIAYNGSACPAGTAPGILIPSTDGEGLAVQLPETTIALEAGRSSGKRVARGTCNFAIPIEVAEGYSVGVSGIAVSGFNSLEEGTRSKMSLEAFFAGQRGNPQNLQFSGPLHGGFADYLESDSVLWSPCGASTVIRLNTSVLVQSNRQKDDVAAGLRFGSEDGLRLLLKRCWR